MCKTLSQFFFIVLFTSSCAIPKQERSHLTKIDNTVYTSKCGDYQQFRIGKLILHNNVWGKQSITNYTQCIFNAKDKNNFSPGWVWQWPMTARVVGYPELIYGANPWHPKSTSSHLPRKVSKRGDILVSYDVDLISYGTHNLAFDIWLNKTSPPTPHSISTEIMIWMEWKNKKNMFPMGKIKAYVTFDNIKYALWIQEGVTLGQPSGDRSYIAFVAEQSHKKATINIDKFVRYLLEHKYINTSHYLSSIEFGTEIISGSGKITFKKYDIIFR